MKTLRATLITLVSAALLALSALAASVLWGKLMADQAVQHGMQAKDLTADVLPPPLYLLELRLVLALVSEGSLSAAEATREVQRLSREFDERAAFWREQPAATLPQALLAAQADSGRRLIAAAAPVLQAAAAGDAAALRTASGAAHSAFAEHRAAVERTVKAANEHATVAVGEYEAAANWNLLRLGIVFLGAGLAVVLLGAWVLRSVMRATGGEPAEVARIANAVADGDLTVQVPLAAGDSTSVMAAMQRMCASLRGMVTQLGASSDAIATGSQQVASGSMDLSARTEQQAANLQQTASAMEQFSGTVKTSAATADQAARLAQRASQVAQRGADAVGEVVATMQGIADGSRRIGEITSLIDGIAFRTNILALNAAVEAARAGEQGRGFAVVATEVRGLATRAAEAAREITGLIGQSVTQVELGTRQVSAAGATMTEIVAEVQRVAGLIGEISGATREQTQGIGLVSGAVHELDTATQQNTALVEESAAAAEALREQADELVNVVRRFRVAAA